MRGWILIALAVLLAVTAGCASTDGKHKKSSGGSAGDGTPPTILSITPDDGSTIGCGTRCSTGDATAPDDIITIVFSETMDTDSLDIGGSMGPYSASWDTTDVTNDTVTLTPTGTSTAADSCSPSCWYDKNDDSDNEFIIDADDLSGESLETVTVVYIIDQDHDGTPDSQDTCPTDGSCQ